MYIIKNMCINVYFKVQSIDYKTTYTTYTQVEAVSHFYKSFIDFRTHVPPYYVCVCVVLCLCVCVAVVRCFSL